MDNGKEYPYNFKLIRGAKGKYRWEITIRSLNYDVIDTAKKLDEEAKAKWGDVSE